MLYGNIKPNIIEFKTVVISIEYHLDIILNFLNNRGTNTKAEYFIVI